MKKLLKQFFTLKPVRDTSITTKRALIGALLIVLTQLGDFLTTWYGVTHAGAQEANPLIEPIVNGSMFNFFIIKVIGASLLIYFTYRRRLAPYIVSVPYVLVILWNILIITLL
jgi:predicted RND superfamily exporter protein